MFRGTFKWVNLVGPSSNFQIAELLIHYYSNLEKRMSLVAINIECLEGKIVKILCVFRDGKVLGYIFLAPKNHNPTFKQSGTLKNFVAEIGTMKNWIIVSCHQSFTKNVHLQQNTLQKG